jgi:hypothetical protein
MLIIPQVAASRRMRGLPLTGEPSLSLRFYLPRLPKPTIGTIKESVGEREYRGQTAQCTRGYGDGIVRSPRVDSPRAATAISQPALAVIIQRST